MFKNKKIYNKAKFSDMKELMNSFEIDDKLYKKPSKQKILIKYLMKFHTKTTII